MLKEFSWPLFKTHKMVSSISELFLVVKTHRHRRKYQESLT